MNETFDCIVIGAGIAGLLAAGRLREAGRRVVVVDKGRGVGGRMATRRVGDSVCDHGAQFMTVRSDIFQRHVDTWIEDGLLTEWYRGTDGSDAHGGGHPRFRGTRGMTTVPKALAAVLDLRLQSPVRSVGCHGSLAQVELIDERLLQAPAVVLTPPIPQTLALLEAGGVAVAPALMQDLTAIDYDPCFAVMARLDGPSGLAPAGFRAGMTGPITWIADNQCKGISDVPAVTLHAGPEFSRQYWSSDRTEVAGKLCALARPMLASDIVDFQIHGWRYSQPVTTYPELYAEVSDTPLLVLAGDACQGPRVEGAALSGLAAGKRVAQFLS